MRALEVEVVFTFPSGISDPATNANRDDVSHVRTRSVFSLIFWMESAHVPTFLLKPVG